MEPGTIRRQRLRRGDDQLSWLDRLRAKIYRLDQRRLGRQTVCRSDEGTRLRGEDVSVHRQDSRGGARGKLRRLHGELDPWSHQPVQMHRVARWRFQYGIRLRNERRALVPGVGVQRTALEKSRALQKMVAALIR